MPALDSIHSTSVRSVQGAEFRIIRTVEIDSYETSRRAVSLAKVLRAKHPSPAAISKVLAKKPVGDNFGGTARKAAKLSISAAPVEKFSDVQALIGSLVEDGRLRAFLYAASRENDNGLPLDHRTQCNQGSGVVT